MRLFKGVVIGVVALGLAGGAVAQGVPLSDDGYSFLQAVKERDGDKVMKLLQSASNLTNYSSDDGQTPLNVSIARRDDTYIAFLLSKGADPNFQARGTGDAALISAARIGYADAVDMLLQRGARVDLANRAGETALIVAVQNHQTAIVKRLLEAGANPDKSDHSQGFSARDYAKRDGARSADLVKLFDTVGAKKPAAGPVLR
ncbi:ankyrin repeat domain-containing protein [Sphingomonas ginkgonis]|uniref:Ankyrin repeat domain-containing protein n=1 Tax=Sphingomonas ginkgonis TaxID=2315330 RepID=A0A3R9YKS4_9SPHN|nr:ankyrin repeat domain-containing protein [Sphingomonas ginkgonis]RST29765.1 ankyrin repeat domain-containing protein [Sphingomonas ginkgonis]